MALKLLAAIIIGYLLGSIPFGYLYGRSRGVDVRRVGFRKIGTSNIEHLFGFGPAALVFFLDIGKGLLPALLGKFWLGTELGVIAGLAAVLGHSWPWCLRSGHGRGVATSLGALLPFAPLEMGVGFGVMALITIVQGSSPLGITVGFGFIPCLSTVNHRSPLIILFEIAILLLLISRRFEGVGEDVKGTPNRTRILLNRLLYDTSHPERKPPLWHRLRLKA